MAEEIVGAPSANTVDLLIRFDPSTNNINIQTNTATLLDNKIMFFGLLESVKIIVAEKMAENQKQNRIQPVTLIPPRL